MSRIAKKGPERSQLLYSENAPLIISEAAYSSAKNELKLKLHSIQESSLQSADLCVIASPSGNAVEAQAAEVKKGELSVAIRLPAGTESYGIAVTHATFSDASEWSGEPCEWTPLECREKLEDALGSRDLSDEYRAQYGIDCVYLPGSERGVWTCTCGETNLMALDRCRSCRRIYSAISNINLSALIAESKRHAELSEGFDEKSIRAADREHRRELRAEEREKRRMASKEARDEMLENFRAKRQEKKASRQAAAAVTPASDAETDTSENAPRASLAVTKKLAFIITGTIACALVLILLAVLPGYAANKSAYKTAVELLSSNRFDEAAEAFEELGNYSDSSAQLEQNVPYQKALYIIDCADRGDATALSLLGLSPLQYNDTEHMQIALYEGAAQILSELNGYKSSTTKGDSAQNSANALRQKLNKADYEAAELLLSEGYYSKALDAFSALGNYSDSPDMVLECLYRKAVNLLEYSELYNVRGLCAVLSHETGTDNQFILSSDAAKRLGSEGIDALNRLLSADGVSIETREDVPIAYLPICECIEKLFSDLSGYKDSEECISRAQRAGDFTRPFFEYCANGKISTALTWLNEYDGEFPNRDMWLETLPIYLPYCCDWNFLVGDPTLIPLTVDDNTTSSLITTSIAISNDTAYINIFYNSAGSCVTLSADLGSTDFSLFGDYNYFVRMNMLNNFTYLKYGEAGLLSSSEYRQVK